MKPRLPTAALLAFVLGLTLGSSAAAEDWPQWGGPNRDFTLSGKSSPKLAESWPEDGPRRLWSRPLGRGLSALVATGGALFTTYGEDGEEGIVSLDAETGRTLWQHRYPVELHHAYVRSFHQGPTSTPAVSSGRVVAVGFTGIVHGLDAETGEPRWSHDLVQDFGARRLRFGHSASPLLDGEQVIVPVGGEVGVLSLDPASGEVLWRSPPLEVSYASPIVARVDGQKQVVFLSAEEVLAVDAESGELLWRAPCRNGFANNASDPIWGPDGRLWIASQPGYGARVLELHRRGEKTAVTSLWSDAELSLHYWNALRLGETVYASIGPAGEDFAALDVASGRVLWREPDRFEKARPLASGEEVILLDETGRLALVRPSRNRLDVLAEHQIFEGETPTVPTLVGSVLYVRGPSRVVALDLSRGRPPSKD